MSVDEEGEVRGSVELGATEEEEAAAVSVALDVNADAGEEDAEECLRECDILGKGPARKGIAGQMYSRRGFRGSLG